MLKISLAFGGVFILLAGSGGAWLFRPQITATGRAFLSTDEEKLITSLAEVYFPKNNPIGIYFDDVDIVAGVDTYLSRLLAREQKLLRALLGALEQYPRLSFSSKKTLSELSLDERTEMISSFETSTYSEKRDIGALLRSLVGMAYFEDKRVLRAIGHRPGCLDVLPS